MSKTKATTMPGGAPLKSKRKSSKSSAKSGAGKSPSKKARTSSKGSSATATKSKSCKPGSEVNPETGRCRVSCKPGYVRNPDTGRCKKIPRAQEPESDSWLDKKIPQGYTPAGNVKTTTARKVGEKVITGAVNDATRRLVDAGIKKYEKGGFKGNLKTVAAAILPFAAKVLKGLAWDAATLGAPLAVLYIGHAAEKAADADRRQAVQIAAYNTVDEIMKKAYLTPDQHRALRAQFEAFYLKQAKDLAFLNSHGGR